MKLLDILVFNKKGKSGKILTEPIDILFGNGYSIDDFMRTFA